MPAMSASGDNGQTSVDSGNTVPAGIEWVELKVTVGAEQVDAGLAGFGLKAGSAERRSIWFCDRIDAHGGPHKLPPLDRGATLRAPKLTRSPDAPTLKLRGPEGRAAPGPVRRRSCTA